MKIFTALFVFIIISQMVFATNYHVSPTGSDKNTGTLQQPWKTIQKVNNTIFTSGDKILFQAGATFKGNFIFNVKSTTDTKQPIIIGSYGKGRATIQVDTANGMLFSNLGGIIVKDLIVRCADITKNRGYGVKFINDKPGNARLKFVRIENVEASGFRWAGIYVGGIPTDLPKVDFIPGCRFGYNDVQITNCVAHDNMYYGIYLTASWNGQSKEYGNENVIIRSCRVYNNTGDSTYTANHSGSGILLDDTDTGLIEHCVSYNNGALNAGKTGGPCGIWTHASDRIVIQFCEAYANKTAGAADGGGFDLDGGVTNSIIQYCYSHDNDGAGYLVWNWDGAPHELAHNIIRYNISSNDGRKHKYGAIHIGTSGLPVKNFQIYNNSIYMPESPGAQPKGIWTGGSKPNENILFYNNVIIIKGNVPLVESAPNQVGLVLQGNAYWQTDGQFLVKYDGGDYTDFKNWQAATQQEMLDGKSVGVFKNPLVVKPENPETIGKTENLNQLKTFQLQANSPLRQAGVIISKSHLPAAKHNFWRKPLKTGVKPNIGAD